VAEHCQQYRHSMGRAALAKLFGLAAQWRAAMLNLRRWIMRENLLPGEKFPDIELVNENDELTKLSSLMRGFPTAVVKFSKAIEIDSKEPTPCAFRGHLHVRKKNLD
jgi:hypothetical protein